MSKDYTSYATAKITPTMEAFADFILANVFDGKLPKGVDEASFRKGVALGGSLRMDFQKSDFWKSDERNYLANVEARRATKAADALAKAEEAAKKTAARLEAAKAKAAAAVAAAKAASDAAAAKVADANAEDTEEADAA
jgi:hypothetical protein